MTTGTQPSANEGGETSVGRRWAESQLGCGLKGAGRNEPWTSGSKDGLP
jgi:hypothetical protein